MSPAEETAQQFERTEVVKIVQSVIHKMEAVNEKSHETVLEELLKLAHVIEETRAEISQVGANEIGSKQVASATDELDAVVDSTKNATFSIMDACEAIQGQLAGMPEAQANTINDNIIRIFEACSFQDITGQRISKVIKLLKEIEGKVNQLLHILGHNPGLLDGVSSAAAKTEGDSTLLNGPQLPTNALDQDEIDRLLNSF